MQQDIARALAATEIAAYRDSLFIVRSSEVKQGERRI
jgi:hypothetical protein